MTTISLHAAQLALPDLIRGLTPGEELVITDNDRPVAKIIAADAQRPAPKLGTLANSVVHVADDFDAPLEDFAV